MKRVWSAVGLVGLSALTLGVMPAAADSKPMNEIQVVTGVEIPEGASARTVRKLIRGAKKKSSLAKVCPSITSFGPGQGLIKSQISHHISPGDPRATGYTYVCCSQCAAAFPVTIYYSDGTQAGRFGYYGRYSANGKPRAYCGAGGVPPCSVSSIYARARGLRTGSDLYLKLNSRQCVRFNGAPGARNGSI